MTGQHANELSPDAVEDTLDARASVQRTGGEALCNPHRAVFAESFVATLPSGAELSPDPAHDYDARWRSDRSEIRIEVKCSGEYLPRYGITHRSPVSWEFRIQKRVWDCDSLTHCRTSPTGAMYLSLLDMSTTSLPPGGRSTS